MKTYIIHETSSKIRKKHIDKELSAKNLTATFILDGDKKDIGSDILNSYFGGELIPLNNATSCAYKHILAYKSMVKDSVDFAIILEDDISLTKNFVKVVNDIVCEVRKRNISNCIISLEDSSLQFVKSSEMAPDKILYKKSKGRMAGAYLVDHSAAENMIHEIENNRCNVPIDWFHNLLASKNLVNIYWSKYNVARQGSLDGSLNSIIDHKPYGFLRIISFNLQYIYKRIVYKFR